MTPKQANLFLSDIQSELIPTDYCQNIYVSIRDIGTRSFVNAHCQSIDGWLFICTKTESFCVQEKNLGDYVCVDTVTMPTYTISKERVAS